MPEADAGQAVRTGIVPAAEQQAADFEGVRNPPRQHQAASLFGEQPVAAGIGRRHQPDCAAHEAGGHIRGPPRSLPGGSGQPGDGLSVSLPGSARQVLRDLRGRRSCPGQPLTGLTVQPAADGGRQIFVDGITDQVVAEPELVTVIFQYPPGEPLCQGLEQLQHGPGRSGR